MAGQDALAKEISGLSETYSKLNEGLINDYNNNNTKITSSSITFDNNTSSSKKKKGDKVQL